MEFASYGFDIYTSEVDEHGVDFVAKPPDSWLAPNAVLVDRKNDKEGQTSAPEWGINLSKKNLRLLDPYKAQSYLESLR